jgi:hypothetical protein
MVAVAVALGLASVMDGQYKANDATNKGSHRNALRPGRQPGDRSAPGSRHNGLANRAPRVLRNIVNAAQIPSGYVRRLCRVLYWGHNNQHTLSVVHIGSGYCKRDPDQQNYGTQH